MCSRFENDAKPKDLMARFDLGAPPPVPNAALTRPTDRALVIGPKRDGALIGFGIPAPWDEKKPLINARAETLGTKPTFRPYLNRRVLVPATGYLEWRKDGKTKHKNHIHLISKALFAFAGLLETDHFTIVTCPPAPEIAHVHDRMPVILDGRQAEADWLDPEKDFKAVAPLLTPLKGDRLEAVEA
jgi:putative SOS response-associated peptidase YedK